MWPAIVIIINEIVNSISEFITIIGWIQIYEFLFDRSPETLYPYIVLTSASAVHTNADTMAFQAVYPLLTCILATLIRIHDLRRSMSEDTCLEKFYAIACRQAVAEFPTNYEPAIHIYNSIQIHKAMPHWDIRYVCTPSLIWMARSKMSEKIRIYVFFHTSLGQTFARINTLNAHNFHQTTDSLMIDSITLNTEVIYEFLNTCCRMIAQDLINLSHKILICLRFYFRLVFECAARYTHLCTKVLDADTLWQILSKFLYLTFSPASSQALAKKSFSTVSSPIFFRRRSFSDLRCVTTFSSE